MEFLGVSLKISPMIKVRETQQHRNKLCDKKKDKIFVIFNIFFLTDLCDICYK